MNSSLKSGENAMPRGRAPVSIVFTTLRVLLSMTVTVLSFSFETKIVSARDGLASADTTATATAAAAVNRIMGVLPWSSVIC